MKSCVPSLRLVALVAALSFGLSLSGQEVRSLDGTGNNPANPSWGATFTRLALITDPAFADDMALPAGADRPNPRYISNSIFAQSGEINDQLNLSDYVWVFGQFVDHDITLVDNDVTEPLLIEVPAGDPVMDPFNTGQVVIPMFRSEYDPTTGTAPGNPRRHINSITAFIDASAIYGSDANRAMWLRAFEGGKLRMSEGGLLPFNTLTGEFNDPRDPAAPFMADDVGSGGKLFVAGDLRANENLLLLAFHTIFVREHNRICDELALKHPEWDDERLYQHARRLVTGHLQSIVYDEWLPAMGVTLPPYTGYRQTIDPSISNVFSAAAFRLGHTLLSGEIIRMGNDGDEISQGNIALRDAFFNPREILLAGGIDPYFKGMGTQIQQDLDCKVIDDVRNFLFGPPGAGGLDLAAINIMRGRERGLADFNSIRAQLGLEPYASFADLCANPDLQLDLQTVYGDVNNVDAWVGMLAEEHMPGTLFGETIMAIMEDQFLRLRDGDRFFYLNDPGLSLEETAEIQETRFSDIIRRNTNITLMQDNVFFAMDHDDIPFANVSVVRRHLDMALFPNPVTDKAKFKAYATAEGDATLTISDLHGRALITQAVHLAHGENTWTVRGTDRLTPGVYFATLRLEAADHTIKLIKG
ncbi:MAG: peroxidase family protein [Saprospiraceae bacterium]|nr:peroxidase family protein [Saprospiraceae bacterium]